MLILVVDDDQDMLEMIEDAVRSQGHQTRGFNNCRAALDCLANDEVDCVITDIIMPDMTGAHLYESAQKINADLPFLFITGAHTVPERIAAATHAFILFKPFQLAELFAAVERLTLPLARHNKISAV